MDICSIDWSAFTPLLASVIASGTALFISNKWSGQKGREVLASESKNLLTELYALREHMDFIDESSEKDIQLAHEISVFETRNNRIQNSLTFLIRELNQEHESTLKKLKITLKNSAQKLNDYKPKNVLENSALRLALVQAYLDQQGESFWGNLGDAIENAIIILRAVALYKNTGES